MENEYQTDYIEHMQSKITRDNYSLELEIDYLSLEATMLLGLGNQI